MAYGRHGAAIRRHSSGEGGSGRSVERAHGAAEAEVVDRKHVEAAEREHQEHLGCPPPNAADGGEMLNHRLVVEAREPVEADFAGERLVRQIEDVARLGAGEARRPQCGDA